jgi:hypothetical protein
MVVTQQRGDGVDISLDLRRKIPSIEVGLLDVPVCGSLSRIVQIA